MTSPEEPVDRRAVQKARLRQAILDAAAALMDERGLDGFTVDDLALRADVSRRTVFNHFGSLSEVVIAVCSHHFDVALDSFRAASAERASSAPRSVMDDVEHDLRTMDLVAPMAYLCRVLRPEGRPLRSDAVVNAQMAHIYSQACTAVSERLGRELTDRHPDADVLDVELMLAFLCSGLPVLAESWAERTGGVDDAASRTAFASLLGRLISALRSAFPSLVA